MFAGIMKIPPVPSVKMRMPTAMGIGTPPCPIPQEQEIPRMYPPSPHRRPPGSGGRAALFALAALALTPAGALRAQDCDGDGIVDRAELLTLQTEYGENFESGATSWVRTGLWRIETGDACGAGSPTLTPASRAVYNRADTCTYNTGGINSGTLTSPVYTLSPTYESVVLKYYDHSVVEGLDPNYDFQRVQVSINGGPFQTVRQDQSAGAAVTIRPWGERTIDLTAFRPTTLQVRFFFDTADNVANDFRGWYVDDVRIQKVSSDCNANTIPDECEDFTPQVLYVRRAGAAQSALASIPFAAGFLEPVNVSGPAAFQVAKTGTVAHTGLTITGSGTTRDITVTGVTGDGTIKVNVLAGTGVTSVCHGIPLPAAFTGGEHVVVDHTAPFPGIATVADIPSCNQIKVTYEGATDVLAGGVASGLATVELYYRHDGGPWTATGLTTTTTAGAFIFTAPTTLGTYEFKLRATDHVGNVSPVPTGPGDDAAVIDTVPPEIVDCPADFTTPCNTNEGFNLNYIPTAIDNCSETTTFEIDPPNPLPYGTTLVSVTVTDEAGNTSEPCTFHVTVVPDKQEPLRLASIPAYDGYVREPDFNSMSEGPVNTKATTIYVGDDLTNWGYRGILSFPTSSLPPGSVVTAARLRLTRASAFGNPAGLGQLRLDMGRPFIGVAPVIDPLDYDIAAAPILDVASSFPYPAGDDHSTFAEIASAHLGDINLSGMTQFRVRFDTESDRDNVRDMLSFHSGEALAVVRPELIIEYYKPSCFEYPVPPAPSQGPFTLVAYATAANDGRVTEYHWTSEVGGVADPTSTTTPVGDTASRQQHQFLLSFDTSALPANATLVSAELQLYMTSRIGSPATLGPLVVDMRNPYIDATSYRYGSTDVVQPEDYQAWSPYEAVATIVPPASINQYTAAFLNPTGLMGIHKGGTTQMKVRFTLPDNGNALSDTVTFATGNFGATSPARPRLTITYMTP